MIRQTANQTKANAQKAATEMAERHGKAWVWRSGRTYTAAVHRPHPDSVIVCEAYWSETLKQYVTAPF